MSARAIPLPIPMEPLCAVRLDLDRGTLDIRSEGLWDDTTLERFLDEMEEVLRRYAASGRPPRSLLTTIDMRGHRIQKSEVVARVQVEVPRYHELSKRSAVLLTHSALLKIQAERLLMADRHRYFTSESVARAWLATGLDEALAVAS